MSEAFFSEASKIAGRVCRKPKPVAISDDVRRCSRASEVMSERLRDKAGRAIASGKGRDGLPRRERGGRPESEANGRPQGGRVL